MEEQDGGDEGHPGKQTRRRSQARSTGSLSLEGRETAPMGKLRTPWGLRPEFLVLAQGWCIRTWRPRPMRMTGRLLIGHAPGRSDRILDGRSESGGQGGLFPRWSQTVEVYQGL